MARLQTYASVSRVQSDEETYDLEHSVVGSVLAGTTADRCGQCGACDRFVVSVAVGDWETDDMAVKDKPHGPVPTAHPDSYGHWDHAQISELLYERDQYKRMVDAAYSAMRTQTRDLLTRAEKVEAELKAIAEAIDELRPSYKTNGKTIVQCVKEALNAEHERDVLERKLRSIVLWLEQNQPDVFRRGIWDAIREDGK